MARSHVRISSLVGLGLLLAVGFAVGADRNIPVVGVHVVEAYPHDRSAFTEGLYYDGGFLYESTGGYDGAGVRKVDLATGEVVQKTQTPDGFFGEGIVASEGRILQLSWKEQTGFIYDEKTFRLLGRISYQGEGWALTRNRSAIYMSDGTSRLRILDPHTFEEKGSIQVTASGKPVDQLNELEWVKGQIYANIWQTSRIARIDPATGHVLGWIDLGKLVAMQPVNDPLDDVPNGIAYDDVHDRLFVTGKRWSAIYQIRVEGLSGAR